MIQSEDISVVVQGNIEKKYIKECLTSLKRTLPDAEIILSTWKGSEKDADGLPYDIAIFSDDPGAFRLNKADNSMNNINRQIISTQEGIKKASRRYILKFRTNMSLSEDGFLRYYEHFHKNAKLLQERLLIVDFFTRNPRVIPMPFHPSDWMLFGLGEDVRKYYDIPLQKEADGLYFLNNENKRTFFRNVYSRVAPEQYICIEFLKKFGLVHCSDYADMSHDNLKATEKFLAENMIVIDSVENGIHFLKYRPNRFFEKTSLLSHKMWHQLYKKYVNTTEDCSFSWFLYRMECAGRHLGYYYCRRYFTSLLESAGLKSLVMDVLSRYGKG